jgi:hypothetical protein
VRPDRGEGGSAAVEFALLLPILLLVLLALVQVGVVARDQLVVTQASRAGAREAAVDGSLEAVTEAVHLAAAGLDADRVVIDVAWGGERGEPVTVSLAYEVRTASPIAGWLLPESVTLRSSSTMRREFA